MDDSSPRPTTPSPSSSSTPANTSVRVLWLLPVALIAVVAVGLIAMLARPRDNDPDAGRPVVKPGADQRSRAALEKLLSLRDLAVGHLENHEFEHAETMLLEIIREVPDDPFGPRNLTICRELAVDKIDGARDIDKFRNAIAKAREAAEQLNKVEARSHVPLVLSARIAVKEGDLDRASAALRKAAEIAPQSAAVWYDLFLLKPISPGEPPAQETVNALRKAHELEPDNLFVLKDWLPLQTQMKDPGLTETVARAKESLSPFAAVIKTSVRIDVIELLDKLANAVSSNQWPVATSTAMVIRNVIVAESARDERYVHLNSLEYVLHDFGPKFHESVESAATADDAVIPVKFTSPDDHRLTILANASDVVVGDFDLDGTTDGAALTGQQIHFSFPFKPQSNASAHEIKVEIGDGYQRVLAVDLDDDVDLKRKDALKANGCALADLDLVVFGSAGLKLFENRPAQGTAAREFVPKPAGEALESLHHVTAVIPADLDLDGDLDLLTISAAGIQLWSNRGNWSFEEITDRSKLPAPSFAPTTGVVVDWDRDTDADILVSGADGLGLLENLRHGRFRWRGLDGDFATVKNANVLLVEQLGTTASWSVIAAGPTGVQIIITDTTAAGLVSAKSSSRLSESPAEKAMSLDFDNDGVRDLLVIEKAVAGLYQGKRDGTFVLLAPAMTGELKGVHTGCVCDVDRDGDEDLILANLNGGLHWLSNDGGNANGWLDVSLSAVQIKANEQNYSRRVNHYAIGSMIEVRAGASHQARVVQGPVTHFGLGRQKKADVVRVLWTNGMPQNVIAPVPDQLICEEQKLIGSCPYLFTWDGERFTFCTDLLWNAPLGLKFAENVIAPWREWEYLKIDGHHLRAKDGRYLLRITAELWEIEYFDELRLFAVDHPVGTDIFTNEKVGPASLAEHKIHTVAAPRIPVAARDTQGRDVLDQVRARDGLFTKTFDHKLAQGLTEDHFLELDLGDWQSTLGDRKGTAARDESATEPPRVMLYLTGWVYPGSTSLRVQHSQNPDLAQPRPPALHAVDARGEWREVRPFMGFPGGKTKTIAVDISDVFAPGSTDHRLRIVTNMEFHWDAAFFTVDDRAVEIRQTELPLMKAELADRGGVSKREWPATGNGPDQFDYHRLVSGDAWPPISGAFTRFGDVQPLLTARDDQLIVMHPGDEIQLAFAVPADPLPAGWVRDFVIYSVGWDKDCDPNTVYGESSEPLPFQEMTVYAHRDGQPRERDADYVRYLQTYQTRTRARSPFWNGVRRSAR